MDSAASERERGHRRRHGPFLPLLLVMVTLAGVVLIQAQQTVARRDALQTLHQAQTDKVETTAKVQQQLATLVQRTRALAEEGNPRASQLIQRFAGAGIDLAGYGNGQ